MTTCPDTSIARHLQSMHGLDIQSEWYYAPDKYRRAMTPGTLHHRHAEEHMSGIWNEASEPHEHQATS